MNINEQIADLIQRVEILEKERGIKRKKEIEVAYEFYLDNGIEKRRPVKLKPKPPIPVYRSRIKRKRIPTRAEEYDEYETNTLDDIKNKR